jgi:hypothetical protein
MSRFRGLPAVLAMLLGGAALAIAAGAVAYALRSRAAARSGDVSNGSSETAVLEEVAAPDDQQALVDHTSAELAETEAASEAALEFQALEADEPAVPEAAIPDDGPRPLDAPLVATRRTERTLPRSAQWTLMAAAVLVGAMVGLMLFLLTGGTIGR